MVSAVRRRFGQHFLVAPHAVERIVAALAPVAGEPLFEIGPGRGALTARLIEMAGRVAATEIDRDLVAELRGRFADDELVLFAEDVLGLRLQRVRDALDAGSRRLVVTGNLPYNISKPIAMKLVRERQYVDRAVLMFQREVAARLTAVPGQRDYGPLGILVGQGYEIVHLFHLGPGCFRPQPRVTSTVTLWRARRGADFSEGDERALRACLSACFARRRQTLRRNLRAAIGNDGAVERLLREADLEGSLRAESVAPDGFRRLEALWDRVENAGEV